MKNTRLRLLAGILLAFGFPLPNATTEEGDEKKEKSQEESIAYRSYEKLAVVIPVKNGTLTDPKSVRFFKEVLAKAEEDGAAAVVFDIDVGDGNVLAMDPWGDTVADLKIPTVAYVNRSALAEGAALACASERILIAKGGRLGLAPAIYEFDAELASKGEAVDMESMLRILNSKSTQDQILAKNRAQAVSLLESLCSRKGRNGEVAAAFVDPDRSLEIDGEVISASGDLLTLSSEMATREFDGKPLFAEKIVEGIDAVVGMLEGKPEMLRVPLSEFGWEKERGPVEVKKEKGDVDLVATDDEGRKLAGNTRKEKENFLRTGEESYEGKIVVIKIDEDDLQNRARFAFFERTVERASEEGATAIIFDLKTPGGYAWYTAQLMVGPLIRAKCPTYAYCNPTAYSAGSMISCACDKIYMAPGGQIGASAVVSGDGEALGESERAKANSAYAAFARSAVEGKDARYRKDVLLSFMVLEHELIVDGEVLDGPDTLLTLSAKEASRVFSGGPLLAEGIVDNIEALVAAEGLEGEIVIAEPLGMERFAELVAGFAGFLIMLGIAGAYMEFKTPGFGIAGLISVLAFSIFFVGHYMAGSLVGYEAVVIVVIGAILLVVEFFIVPGTMIFGATGLLLMVGGLIYTMAGLDWGIVEGDAVPRDISGYGNPIMNATIGFGGAVIAIGLLMRYLPETSMFRWLVLENSVGGRPTLAGGLEAKSEAPSLVGNTGVSQTALKPSGKALIGDDYLNVISDGSYVNAGEAVRVISQEGRRIVVEKIGDSTG